MAEARSAKSRPKEMRGQITSDGIARMRARVGILAPRPKPFNTVASEDSIRHYCYGYGEDNPLHTDPDYGATTRWGSVVAPPAYMTTCGIVNAKPIPPDVREKGRGALSGVPNYLSGNSWEFYRPIHPGDVITRRFYLSKVEEKETSFGGKSAVVHHKNEYVNQHGELTGVLMNYFFHVEREASEKKGKNLTIDDPAYDEAYLAKIDEAYANEYIRGAEPRYWEDVAEGDRLPSIVRGPLCVTDIICWHIGNGFGQFNVGPLRAAYRNRVKAPNFYTHNEYGAWDAAQRVHWDAIRAKRIGNPRPYDYGRMRTQWMMQLVGNWAGDDGWLFRHSDQIREFNYIGDTSWVHGKVVAKRVDGVHRVADLEVWIENQRGEVTAPGQASVVLPSREAGPITVPGETGDYAPAAMATDYSVVVE